MISWNPGARRAPQPAQPEQHALLILLDDPHRQPRTPASGQQHDNDPRQRSRLPWATLRSDLVESVRGEHARLARQSPQGARPSMATPAGSSARLVCWQSKSTGACWRPSGWIQGGCCGGPPPSRGLRQAWPVTTISGIPASRRATPGTHRLASSANAWNCCSSTPVTRPSVSRLMRVSVGAPSMFPQLDGARFVRSDSGGVACGAEDVRQGHREAAGVCCRDQLLRICPFPLAEPRIVGVGTFEDRQSPTVTVPDPALPHSRATPRCRFRSVILASCARSSDLDHPSPMACVRVPVPVTGNPVQFPLCPGNWRAGYPHRVCTFRRRLPARGRREARGSPARRLLGGHPLRPVPGQDVAGWLAPG